MRILALILFLLPLAANGEIQKARMLIEAGRFAEAQKALRPAAQSGNADAEQLIGVIYALGLGVEKDAQRAFEWYLRAAMKGHPGAQAEVGFYFEKGLGIAAPDLTRAYLWYSLASLGRDPDATSSRDSLAKEMTPEQTEKARLLIEDYSAWLFPFR